MNRHIQRLTESAEVRAAKDVPTPVIVDSKPQEIFRCPHCKDEIHEKHTYVRKASSAIPTAAVRSSGRPRTGQRLIRNGGHCWNLTRSKAGESFLLVIALGSGQ